MPRIQADRPDRHRLRAGLLALLMQALSGCAALQALQVLNPESVPGVSCPSAHLCLDDPERLAAAAALYEQGLRFVNELPWQIRNPPRVTFCSSAECYAAFGFGSSAGTTVETLGIVIGPRGWADYYLRHEMIHHLQAEQQGPLLHSQSPAWFKEGMAYALSEDPREPLGEPFQSYRKRFREWSAGIGPDKFWQAAAGLP